MGKFKTKPCRINTTEFGEKYVTFGFSILHDFRLYRSTVSKFSVFETPFLYPKIFIIDNRSRILNRRAVVS